jgi:hypothetical protein
MATGKETAEYMDSTVGTQVISGYNTKTTCPVCGVGHVFIAVTRTGRWKVCVTDIPNTVPGWEQYQHIRKLQPGCGYHSKIVWMKLIE